MQIEKLKKIIALKVSSFDVESLGINVLIGSHKLLLAIEVASSIVLISIVRYFTRL